MNDAIKKALELQEKVERVICCGDANCDNDYCNLLSREKKADAVIALVRADCARIAREGCLVALDGGSPTEAEGALCGEIARRILLRDNFQL